MANNPKKVKDPTEVALSAIQEALNISGDNNADNARASARNEIAPPPPPRADIRRTHFRHAPEHARAADVRADRGAARLVAPRRQ